MKLSRSDLKLGITDKTVIFNPSILPERNIHFLNNKIEATIISNTSDTTRENLQNTQSHQKGGLSGKPIELKSSELIRKFYKVLKGRIKIIGVGGVDSGRSAYQKFLAGADYLQLYTGMVFRGPNIVGLIKKELKEILLKDGVKNFNEIVGKKD